MFDKLFKGLFGSKYPSIGKTAAIAPKKSVDQADTRHASGSTRPASRQIGSGAATTGTSGQRASNPKNAKSQPSSSHKVNPSTSPLPPAHRPSSNPAIRQARQDLSTIAAGRARVPSEDELSRIVSFPGTVMTAKGGSIVINDAQRGVIAALDDGTLLIAQSAALSAQVSTVKRLLEHSNFDVTEAFLVDLKVIREVYEAELTRRAGDVRTNRDNQAVQRQFLDLIRRAAHMRCSDIHISVDRHEALIRVRADGMIMKLDDLKAPDALDLVRAAFAMADASDANYQHYEYQGARIASYKTSLPAGVQAIRLQFSPRPDEGRYLVMRLLYEQKTKGMRDVDALGYSARHVRDIKRMRQSLEGIIIFSGPTGSGKSTTLQTALEATMILKNNTVNCITVEDPPEYQILNAIQLPVTNAQTDEERREKFRQAIVASLRSDPDILMIGEIRDDASASLAFQGAMSGHQVWASLHANDALSILDRLRDMKVENYRLADPTLIIGLVGQRLVRKICDHCKFSFEEAIRRELLDPELATTMINIFGDKRAFAEVKVANPDGCEKCAIHGGKGNGYTGRTVVAEVVRPDRKLMSLVGSRDKVAAHDYWISDLAGMTILEHALIKVARGEVDPREIGGRVGHMGDVDPVRIARLIDEEAALERELLEQEEVLARKLAEIAKSRAADQGD